MNRPTPEQTTDQPRSFITAPRWYRENYARRFITNLLLSNVGAGLLSAGWQWYDAGAIGSVKDVLSPAGIAVAFFISLAIELHKLQQQNTINWKRHLTQDRTQIQELLKNADVVLRIDIKPLDHEHISVIQTLLSCLDDRVKSLYALDASLPAHWWSNSMLGYLAIQSKWASADPSRSIHRIFVLSRSELDSTHGRKIIGLHTLMGFRTYIVLNSIFEQLYEAYNELDVEAPPRKEFVIWDNVDSFPSKTNLPKKLKSKEIYGYQSFWLTSTPHEERETGDSIDITDITGERLNEGSDETRWSEIEIKFEFITRKFKRRTAAYVRFMDFLISQAVRCNDEDDIRKLRADSPKILEIPSDCDEGVSPMDINTIHRMVDQYIKLYG